MWQVVLKKSKLKLDLLSHIYMLLMIEKGIRGGICYAIHRYVLTKVNNNYMENYHKYK